MRDRAGVMHGPRLGPLRKVVDVGFATVDAGARRTEYVYRLACGHVVRSVYRVARSCACPECATVEAAPLDAALVDAEP